MARKSQVRYFASRNAYYCQIKGRQHKLAEGPDDQPDGPTFQAACKAHWNLISLDNVGQAGAENTVRVILESYLQAVEEKVVDSTMYQKINFFKILVDTNLPHAGGILGNLRCSQLKPWHLEQLIAHMRKPHVRHVRGRPYTTRWGDPSVHNFLAHVGAAFNWAVRKGLIPHNPVQAVDLPPLRSCARDQLLTPAQHQAVLRLLDPADLRKVCLRNIVIALENTGARPGELIAAICRDFKPDLGAIVYYRNDVRRVDEFKHKTAKVKDRTIYFTGEALALVQSLVATKKPGDHLFPSRPSGTAYTLNHLSRAFVRLRDRVGIPGFIPYFYRHTYATAWLSSGGSVDVLAALLGNTPDTIRKHYSHLLQAHDAVRAQLQKFRPTGGTETPS